MGTIFYNGTQTCTPNSVYLKVYKTPSGGSETLHATYSQPLVGGAYAFSAAKTNDKTRALPVCRADQLGRGL
ncbi:MAG: hypothetical protein WCP35_16925 [Verrucomicrobiota bacterium]